MRLAWLLWLSLVACGGDDRGKVHAPALLRAPAAKVAPGPAQAVRSTQALVAACTAPYAPLGAFSLTSSQHTKVSEGGTVVSTLDTSEALSVSAQGELAQRRSTSDGLAREVIFSGGQLFLAIGPPPAEPGARAVAGKFHRRAPTSPDEPARLAGETFTAFGETLALVAPYTQVSDGGPVDVAGKKGHKVVLALAGKPAGEPHAGTRAWRDTLVVTALSGEVVVDETSGLPLSGQLTATGTFERDGRHFTLELGATHQLGAATAIAAPPPDQVVDTPQRSHDVEVEDRLLDGLAPRKRPRTP